ncbi:MAG: CvpA family protein [Rhodothermales bacterium]|nr:CvpA family protein [Rhodothermales bacterium]
MALLDVIILAVVALGFTHGFRTGLIIQVSSLAGLILAFIAAALFMNGFGDFLVLRFGLPDELGPFIGFLSIFLVVRVAVQVVAIAVKSMVGKLKLSGLDRVSGGFMGALKAAVVLSLAFLVLGFAELPGSQSRLESELYHPVYSLVPDAWSYISNNAPAFEEFRRDVEERLQMGKDALPV